MMVTVVIFTELLVAMARLPRAHTDHSDHHPPPLFSPLDTLYPDLNPPRLTRTLTAAVNRIVIEGGTGSPRQLHLAGHPDSQIRPKELVEAGPAMELQAMKDISGLMPKISSVLAEHAFAARFFSTADGKISRLPLRRQGGHCLLIQRCDRNDSRLSQSTFPVADPFARKTTKEVVKG